MLTALVLASAMLADTPLEPEPARIDPVPFTAVKLTDRFWAPRLEVNRTVTIPACFKQCETTGRIANFDRAAGKDSTPFQGNCYDDSDVYKVMEGAAYSLAQHPDPALDAYLDQLIARIAAAQEPDGYLYTIATANKRSKDARWKDEQWSHETYCAGHLFEAAVAHHQATGKDSLLNVAKGVADLLVREYLKGGRKEVPGHEEVEIGLVRLYRETGNKDYLDLARHFLLARGVADGRELYGDYCQDHLPLVNQREAVGHAVRAGYLYTGMADLAAVTGEATFDQALDAIWSDCVSTKMHLTGGIGAFASNEGFGKAYDLPNESAYLETCAAIANSLWNHRMFLRTGRVGPVDVLERTLYNGMASGVSLSGDRFFYPNPLACDGIRPFNHGTLGRAPWFGCACCPVNVARFLPSIAGLVYATSPDADPPTIWANLFIQSEARIPLGGSPVTIKQTTDYPWDGAVVFDVDPGTADGQGRQFTLAIRIPGYCRNLPVPSDLYRELPPAQRIGQLTWGIQLNDAPLEIPPQDGYVRIDRVWKPGDRVRLSLPMQPRRMVANQQVEADRGRVAVERGPLVYCVESIDQGSAQGTIRDRFLPDDGSIAVVDRPDLLGGIVALDLSARTKNGSPAVTRAIPYAYWANREVGEMAVWLPRNSSLTETVPPPTLASTATASASHTWASDTPRALNDRRVPKSKSDGSIPRHTWWNQKGTTEWVQYDWKEPQTIHASAFQFFDDLAQGGGCGLPTSWRLLARPANGKADEWTEIARGDSVPESGAVQATFPPTATRALRLEVKLQAGKSGGTLEWSVE